MSWTIDRIKEELQKLCAADHITLDVPVSINGRLTRVMGRVGFKVISDIYVPKCIEFSRNLIENASDEDIIQVIKHEYVHYFLSIEDPTVNHHHDAVFKYKCAEIGCTHDKASQYVKGFRDEEAKAKYEVWCVDCCKLIGTYARKCKTLNNISSCKCRVCGGKQLVVKQNW
jgi:predicted SprT family Zn-dependent metalloprotease